MNKKIILFITVVLVTASVLAASISFEDLNSDNKKDLIVDENGKIYVFFNEGTANQPIYKNKQLLVDFRNAQMPASTEINKDKTSDAGKINTNNYKTDNINNIEKIHPDIKEDNLKIKIIPPVIKTNTQSQNQTAEKNIEDNSSYNMERNTISTQRISTSPRKFALLNFVNLITSGEFRWLQTGIPNLLFYEIEIPKKIVLSDRETSNLTLNSKAAVVEFMNKKDIDLVLWGDFKAIENTIYISANLVDKQGNIKFSVEAKTEKDNIFNGVDDLAHKLSILLLEYVSNEN